MSMKRNCCEQLLKKCFSLFIILSGVNFISETKQAMAQSKPSVVTFTLAEAVGLALTTNPEVLAVRERFDEFKQLVKETKSDVFPQVSAVLAWRKTRDPGLLNSPFFTRFAGGEGQSLPSSAFDAFFFTNYLWNFDVSQKVYSFGRISNALKVVKEERSGIDLDVREVENRISLDVARAVYGYLLAKQNLHVLEVERESRKRQLNRIQSRFEVEDATQLDLLRARVTLANLGPEILSSETAVQVAKASVNNTLGRSIDAPIEVREQLTLVQPFPNIMQVETLLEIAKKFRPELRRYAVDRKVLDAQVGVTKSELLPQISASAGFGVSTFDISNVSNFALHTWNAGVDFNWKLFDGKRTYAQVAVLRSQKTQSEYDEKAFRNQLSVRLTEASGAWNRALEALSATKLTVAEAKEAERIAEELLQNGAATTLDVFQATLSLRKAELNQTVVYHDALLALAEMKYLVGFRADSAHSIIEKLRPIADNFIAERIAQ